MDFQEQNISQAILENLGEAVIVVDVNSRIQFINQAAEKLFGYSLQEAVGKNFKIFFHEPLLGWHQEYLDILQSESFRKPVLRESTGMRRDGTTLPLDLILSKMTTQNVSFLIISARNALKRKTITEQVKYQASRDPLTGLASKEFFIERINTILNAAKKANQMVGVVCCNLDRFSLINNTLGRNIGDEFLEKVGKRIKNCSREGDVISRFAGDEFYVLLPYLKSPNDSVGFSNRLIDSLRYPFIVEERELYITASLGISIFPTLASDSDSLISNANLAMREAKKNGRNGWKLFSIESNIKTLDSLMIYSQLHGAVKRKELFLNFQPIVDARNLTLKGAEALVRWTHPELGKIPPSDFIPVAEETGFIDAIGKFVMMSACAQIKAWQDQKLPTTPISVNVSTPQFKSEKFVDIVCEILESSEMNPELLHLEVTESLMMENVEESIAKLKRLREYGIKLCIDDFGTGYSSFQYLKRFPVDILKIDQSFVRDVVSSAGDATIVSAMIDIAHRLRLETTAEGVENREQMLFLREQGCDYLQGYLFDRPKTSEEFTQLLTDHYSDRWKSLLQKEAS
jgi:diguanylate cyclase (GGDEF)-like protein/PAS domain S-box-containing protein